MSFLHLWLLPYCGGGNWWRNVDVAHFWHWSSTEYKWNGGSVAVQTGAIHLRPCQCVGLFPLYRRCEWGRREKSKAWHWSHHVWYQAARQNLVILQLTHFTNNFMFSLEFPFHLRLLCFSRRRCLFFPLLLTCFKGRKNYNWVDVSSCACACVCCVFVCACAVCQPNVLLLGVF